MMVGDIVEFDVDSLHGIGIVLETKGYFAVYIVKVISYIGRYHAGHGEYLSGEVYYDNIVWDISNDNVINHVSCGR